MKRPGYIVTEIRDQIVAGKPARRVVNRFERPLIHQLAFRQVLFTQLRFILFVHLLFASIESDLLIDQNYHKAAHQKNTSRPNAEKYTPNERKAFKITHEWRAWAGGYFTNTNAYNN
jgi:hypothetical protein